MNSIHKKITEQETKHEPDYAKRLLTETLTYVEASNEYSVMDQYHYIKYISKSRNLYVMQGLNITTYDLCCDI